ncbi:hypothetical protein SprV_0902722200 [Sparganum proliferum]
MSPNQKQIHNVPSSSEQLHGRQWATGSEFECKLNGSAVDNAYARTQTTKCPREGPVGLSHSDSCIVPPVCQLPNDTGSLGRAEVESKQLPRSSTLGSSGSDNFSGSSICQGQHNVQTSQRKIPSCFPDGENINVWSPSSSYRLRSQSDNNPLRALGARCLLQAQTENSNQLGTNSRQTRTMEEFKRSLEQLAAEVHNDNLKLTDLLQAKLTPPKPPPGPSKEDLQELRNSIKQLAGELKTENQQLENALQASLASRSQALKEKSQPPNSTDAALLEAIEALKTSVRALATEVEDVTGKHVPEQASALTNAISAISASAKGMFSKFLSSKSHAEEDSNKGVFAEINGEEDGKKKGMFSKLMSLKSSPAEQERDSLSSLSPPAQVEPERSSKAPSLASSTTTAAAKPTSIYEKAKKSILSRNSVHKTAPPETPRRDTAKNSTVAKRSTISSRGGTEGVPSVETPRRSTGKKSTIVRRSEASKSVRSQATRKSSSKPAAAKPSQIVASASEPPSDGRASVISTATPVESAEDKVSVVSSQGGTEKDVPLARESRVSAVSAVSAQQTPPAVGVSALPTDVRCYAPDGTLIRDSGKCPHYASVPYAPKIKQPSQYSKGISEGAVASGVDEPRPSQQSSGSTRSVLQPNLLEAEDRRISQSSRSSLQLSGSQAEDRSSVRTSLLGERRGSGEQAGSDSLNEKSSSQDLTPKPQQKSLSADSNVPTSPNGSSDRTDQLTPSITRSLVSSSLADHLNPLIVQALEEIKTSVAIIDREAHRRNTKVPTPPPPSPPPLPDPVIIEAIDEIRRSLRSMQKDAVVSESTASESSEAVKLLKDIKTSLQRLAENKKKAEEKKKKAAEAAAAAEQGDRARGGTAAGPRNCCCCSCRRRRPNPSFLPSPPPPSPRPPPPPPTSL